MTSQPKIPRPTIRRLSFYLRELESLLEPGRKTISSRQLGDLLGLTDAQVRKDLAYFGQFGYPGVGYRVLELVEELRKILGTDRVWKTAVVGMGNIGRAVTRYKRLQRKGFEIAAIFDTDPALVGTVLAGHHVHTLEELKPIFQERDIKIGLLAVPAEAAQEVADLMVEAGVQGILNFAPVRLKLADSVAIVSVHLTMLLEQLAFKVSLGLTGSRDDRESEQDADPNSQPTV